MATKATRPNSLADELKTLGAALAQKYPRYAGALAKPVSEAARKKALGAKVPEELARLWGFADGAEEFFASPECEGMDFLSVSAAESALEELTGLAVGLPKDSIPFATDGAGNYVCIDARGGLFDWDHETRKAKPIKKSLTALVAAVAAAATRGKFLEGPEVVANQDAQMAKAMKLIEKDPKGNGFKINSMADTLSPEDGVAVLRALAARPEAERDAWDWLALAEARAGLFKEAIASGKKGRFAETGTLHEVGERALKAGKYAEAEEAFAAIKAPDTYDLLGIAVAQKALGKNPEAALKRAEAENGKAAEKPVDWTSATSCYHRVSFELGHATVVALRGDVAAAKKSLAAAKQRFEQAAQKGVRQQCLKQLDNPADDSEYAAIIAKLAGLA